MKKTLLSLSLLALFTAFTLSCNKVPPSEEQTPSKPDKIKLEPGIYTFKASPLKGKWEVGDKIFVHGSYGPVAQMITLTAADISADGKTASAQLDKVTEYPIKPDGLYAAWPGEAAITGDELLENKTSFNRCDILLSVAYLSGKEFVFIDAMCGLRFKASGYTDYSLAANNRSSLEFSDYTPEYTSIYSAFYNFKNKETTFLKGKLTDDPVMLWFPGSLPFPNGYTIYLGKDGEWPVAYTVNKSTTINIGEVIDLGDISDAAQSYTGPGPMIPEMGNMTRYAVKFNELSGLCVDQSGDFLWCLGDSGEICQVSTEGELLHRAGLRTTKGSELDSEGLSVNYDTGDLLISCEPNVICRIPSATIGDIFNSSTFKGVESLLSIEDAKSFGNSGAEGCTYYKDGMAYIGTQSGAYLFLCKLETGEVLWKKSLREKCASVKEIAGLSYDPLTDWLWVVDSESHKFFAFTGDGEQLLGIYPLKTKSNEESICVDHKNKCIWIGDDYGSTSYIFKYEFTGLDDFIISGD